MPVAAAHHRRVAHQGGDVALCPLLVGDHAPDGEGGRSQNIAHEVDDGLGVGAPGRAAGRLGEGQTLVGAVGRRVHIAQAHLAERSPGPGKALGAEPRPHRRVAQPREGRGRAPPSWTQGGSATIPRMVEPTRYP